MASYAEVTRHVIDLVFNLGPGSLHNGKCLLKHQLMRWLFFLFPVVIVLSGCTSASNQSPPSAFRIINSGTSFGQSFTAQYAGFSGVAVMLAPEGAQDEGDLTFHLRANTQSVDDIASKRLSLSEIITQSYYTFNFPVQRDSQRKDYYLLVDVEGGGQVRIFTASPDTYLDGALYVNQTPQESQLGFQLLYDRQVYLLSLGPIIGGWIVKLIFALLLFILPGWGLFSLLWPSWDTLRWGTKLGLSGALSLAIYPLLMLWTNLVGISLGAWNAIIPPLAGVIAIGWKNRSFFNELWRRFHLKNVLSSFTPFSVERFLPDLAYIVILGLLIWSKFWIIQPLDIPLFGDSYQHTMITQLIIDHGGLFNSWQPYADLVTFTYHFGFHSAAAVYHWMTGATAEQSVLWTGQLVNILAIMSLYPLAIKISQNKWGGVVAMLIGGLLSPMPNYYVNWGRYTQLAGQVILLAAIWVAWMILERSTPESRGVPWVHKMADWKGLSLDVSSLVIVWLFFGGLALTHYRILVLAVLFFATYGIFSLSRTKILYWAGRTLWIGLGGMLLFLPWFIHLLGGKIMHMVEAGISTLPSSVSVSGEFINVTRNFQAYLPLTIWVLILPCLVLGLWKLKKDLAIFTLWWLFIILATNPSWIGLPGNALITNFAIVIAFYIPASIIIASSTEWLLESKSHLESRYGGLVHEYLPKITVSSLILLMVCVLGVFGGLMRISDLDQSSFALVTRPDLRAMKWIKENLPNDAKFLINSFFAYNNSMLVGSDGGWWIPLLTGRRTSVPPLTYGFEMGVESATYESTIDLAEEIQLVGISAPETIELLLQNGYKYVYIGQRQGSINYTGPKVLDPVTMSGIPDFKTVYHQDRVWIFEVLP
jgi:hypothetical protein